MGRGIKIAPSLLAADFSQLGKEVESVEAAGADWLHVDVMDGHFVPNITVGAPIVKAVRAITKLPLDVHLMIENPENFIADFAQAGSDYLTVHVEACKAIGKTMNTIKSFGMKAGCALNPETSLSAIRELLDQIDMVVLMTVNPGFGGQSFIESVLPKVSQLRGIWDGDIEVDGGVDRSVAKRTVDAGANILVAGTAVFGKIDRKEAIRALKG